MARIAGSSATPSTCAPRLPTKSATTCATRAWSALAVPYFQAHLKLKTSRTKPTRTLIINGAECEPFITCDDMLMRERAPQIVSGMLIMQHILGAEEVLVGIEDNKPAAVAVDEGGGCGRRRRRLQRGRDSHALPCRRRQAAHPRAHRHRSAAWRALHRLRRAVLQRRHRVRDPRGARSRPAADLRIVTVAGNVGQPRNYEVLIGTPMNELAAHAGEQAGTDAYIMGGPMMGFRMPAFDVPVVKATNCVLVSSPSLFPPAPPEMNCIRCGECAKACRPICSLSSSTGSRAPGISARPGIPPLRLHRMRLLRLRVPSHIRLVDYYRFAKSEIWARERDKGRRGPGERFDFRNLRQEREKQEKAARLAAKAAETVPSWRAIAAARPVRPAGEAPRPPSRPRRP